MSLVQHTLCPAQLTRGLRDRLPRPPNWITRRQLRFDLHEQRDIPVENHRIGELTLVAFAGRISMHEVEEERAFEQPLRKSLLVRSGIAARLGRSRAAEP